MEPHEDKYTWQPGDLTVEPDEVMITVWPPIGGAQGEPRWRAVWEAGASRCQCFATSEKAVLAKARRMIRKIAKEA